MRVEYDDNGRAVGDDGGVRRGSSLRVTFLVNIWTARWPSGVGVLPGSMRRHRRVIPRRVRGGGGGGGGRGWRGAQAGPPPGPSSSFRNSLPLSFERRRVSEITVPRWWSRRRPGWQTASDEDVIVLPFVSKGATLMDDDDDDDDDDANDADGDDDVEMSGSIDGDGSGTTAQDKDVVDDDDDNDDDDDDDDDEEEEEG